MAQLFPRWANSAVRALLIAGALSVVGVPLGLLAWARTPAATGQYRSVVQPVAFSHPVHVTGLRIDCRYCHAGAERSAFAGVPPTVACVGCHDERLLASQLFEPVRKSLQTQTPIAWQRVTAVPDFVFFNHAAHTRKGVACESCHGRVDLMARVTQVAPLTMTWCLDCHRAPERQIRPKDSVTVMGWAPSGDRAAMGRALVRAYHVRSITTCTACHR